MITVEIPDFCRLQLQHLVLDYNGTLARDGKLLAPVPRLLRALARLVRIHIVTADTFGMAVRELEGLPVELKILPVKSQAAAKSSLITKLGADAVVAIGNGRNDRKMLKAAALGIVVVQGEGAAAQTVAAADVVVTNIKTALELLLNAKRLKATLRS
jgi:soluble P-type ATPase